MTRVFNFYRCASGLSLALAILASSAAKAQSAAPAAEATTTETGDSGQISEIIVTAQRRAESAQSVPISLQAFSADGLRQVGIRSTDDLASAVGGLLIQQVGPRPNIYVRGVGNNSGSATPSVLTFIDGVYIPFSLSSDLVNIETLEVLKGPQGTLFGRNATGGILQITTKLPSETPHVRAEVGYSSYQTVDASGYVTGGIAPGVALDLALSYSNQGDGLGKNNYNQEDVFQTKRFAARSRLNLVLGDRSNLTFAGYYMSNRGILGNNINPAFGYECNVYGCLNTPFFPTDYSINAGPKTPYFTNEAGGGSATFTHEFDAFDFKSITSYQVGHQVAFVDGDGGPGNFAAIFANYGPRKAFSQELQLVSSDKGPLKWTVGLYYFWAANKQDPFDVVGFKSFNTDTDKSIAPYAQMTYEVLPDTNLTLGGRFTYEKRGIEGFVMRNGTELPGTRGKLSQTFKEPTWRVALDHKFGPVFMAYASVSRGFNAGFYNVSNNAGYANETQNPPVKPEFLTAYEVGFKSDLFDRHLRINASAFLYDYSGLQQQLLSDAVLITINAAKARIKGVDFEVVAKPLSSLTASLSGTYLDAKYKSYPLAPDYVLLPNFAVPRPTSTRDAAGKFLVSTPKITFTATLTHVLETGIGSFTTSANVNYRGESYADPNNKFKVPTRYLTNISERWDSVDKKLFATLWMKNVFDVRYDYSINISAPTGLTGNHAPPQTYGASLGFNF